MTARPNPNYNASIAIRAGIGADIRGYAREMKHMSSVQCERLTAIPLPYGLPNCMTYDSSCNTFVVGTTNGQLLIFDKDLALLQVNDINGDGTGDVITSLAITQNFITCGVSRGTIIVWDTAPLLKE